MADDPTRIALSSVASRDPFTATVAGYVNHTGKWFEAPFITVVNDDTVDSHTLYQGGCQAGLVLPRHIKHLVSLYPWESYAVHHQLRSSLYVHMHDSLEQSADQAEALGHWVNSCRRDGSTLVHCQAGLNRSALVLGAALILTGLYSADAAIKLLRDSRSSQVLSNPEFEKWLKEFGKGRGHADT